MISAHGEEQLTVVRLAGLVDGAKVRMVECAGDASLVQETLSGVAVEVMGAQRKLESDRSPEVSVFGAVDDSHSAVCQKLDDAEMGNGLSDQSQRIRLAFPRSTV